jgi:hypothetical protein
LVHVWSGGIRQPPGGGLDRNIYDVNLTPKDSCLRRGGNCKEVVQR